MEKNINKIVNVLKGILIGDLANYFKIYSKNFLLKNNNLIFTLEIEEHKLDHFKKINNIIESEMNALDFISKIDFLMTSHKKINVETKKIKDDSKIAKYIIPVASGKGGVGKSTTSINLALAIQSLEMKVGILDADIYGPSLPRLTGINVKPDMHEKKLIPHNAFGLQSMSIGYLLPEDSATIWRGPMVMSAINQLLTEVKWNNLDFLIIDMPPGTGDAQLTLSQKVQLAGAIIVSTPQDLSLIDARKGLNMFKKVNVPILGIIENMSYFLCNKCNTKHEIFGHGGAKKEAIKLGVPFLGEIPLDIDLRSNSDEGKPIFIKSPENYISTLYLDIAKKIIKNVKKSNLESPKIIFD